MAKFPPTNWSIKPLQEMGAFTINSKQNDLLIAALVAAEPSGEAQGSFQLVLGGMKSIDFSVPMVDVIPHPAFMNMELAAQLQPGINTHPRPNSTVTDWMDLKDLVASQDMEVVDGEGENVTEEFLKLLEKNQEGAALRWAISATSDPEKPLELRLQSLPVSLSKVKAVPAFMEASAAAVTLLQLPLGGDYFNSPNCLGPIPILFSSDLEATSSWARDSARIHEVCQQLYSRICQLEVLSIKEAVAYINSPRPGITKDTLSRDYTAEPATKKRRTGQDQDKDSTGSDLCSSLARLTVRNFIDLPTNLHGHAFNLLESGLSKQTWLKYKSGWNSFILYSKECEIEWFFPIQNSTIRGYIVWCASRGLTESTIKNYIAAISLVQVLNGHSKLDSTSDILCKLLLKGVKKNVPKLTSKHTRRAMTIPLLEILGHHISKENWSGLDKQAVWAASTVAFFTSARMGELLFTSSANSSKTLTWKNIFFYENRIMIKLDSRKNSYQGGLLDVFEVAKESYCPVTALIKLRDLVSVVDPDLKGFVFNFKNKPLTVAVFNNILKKCFHEICKNESDSITSHSFRAAIPTAIMKVGVDDYADTIKKWGGWNSNCYTLYTKLESGQKRVIFSKILDSLKSDN